MSTVVRSKDLCIYDGNVRMDSILTIVRKRTGRRKVGSFRLNLLSGRDSADPSVVSDICIKFRIKSDEDVSLDDPVLLNDLMYADLPWSGYILTGDEKLDDKYVFYSRVRNVVNFNKFIFQLRELGDGKPYSDGLVHWHMYNHPEGFTYDIKSGLKQIEVVESFQNYYAGVDALEQYLTDTGYVKENTNEWHLFDHLGETVSKIDVSLLGMMFFKPLR